MEESKSRKRALVDANDSDEGTVAKKMKDFEAVFPTRQQFLESCKTQKFSLPMPVIEYIIMNPASPAVYQKLIQSCKWFFIRNPILVFKDVYIKKRNDWKSCVSKTCLDFCTCSIESLKTANMEEIQSKIWLSKKLYVHDFDNTELISTVIPRINFYNLQCLSFSFVKFSYDELKFLSSDVKDVKFIFCTFCDNGKHIPLEDVVKLYGSATHLAIAFKPVQDGGICEDYDKFISACQSIRCITFTGFSQNFDVEQFYKKLSIVKNRSMIYVIQQQEVEKYKIVINQIIATKEFDFVPPVIIQGRDENGTAQVLISLQVKAFKKLL